MCFFSVVLIVCLDDDCSDVVLVWCVVFVFCMMLKFMMIWSGIKCCVVCKSFFFLFVCVGCV